MRPFFQILQGSTDIVSRVGSRNISLTIMDGVGRNADSIQYSIDDKDGFIDPRFTGVEVRVIAGYREGRVRDFGLFKIESVDLQGFPQIINITGQSVDAVGANKTRRKQSYRKNDYETYGEVFGEIARRNSLTLAIPSDLRGKPLRYEAQSEEGDYEFATRIGDKIGAAVTIKSGHLTVSHRGRGQSVTGQRLPIILVQRGVNLLSYQVSLRDKPKHATVKATWFDRSESTTKEIEQVSFGEGPPFLIREPFASREEALEAAAAKAADLKRAIGTANFDIAGDPFAMAEADVEARGIRQLVDGVWRATSVTHSFSATSDYRTSLSCESPEAGPTSVQPPLPPITSVPTPTPRPR